MTFAMTDWKMASGLRTAMSTDILNGKSTDTILDAAMQKLIDSFGRTLANEATALFLANPPTSKYPFNSGDIDNYLRDGNLKYNQSYSTGGPTSPIGTIAIPLFTPLLLISDVASGTSKDINAYTYTDINAYEIHLNAQAFLDFFTSNPTLFPDNAVGQARLEIIYGKTILHEILHNHNFSHSDRDAAPTNYDPTHEYWRSFPETAEQAYFLLHQAEFPSGTTTVLNLLASTSTGPGICGSR